MAKATCSSCGKPVFRGPDSRPEIICQECRRQRPGYKPKLKPWQPSVAACATCAESYTPQRRNQKYCSERCKNRRPRNLSEAAQRRRQARERARVRPSRTCPVCCEQYHPTCGDQLYCSRRCGGISKTGWPTSPVKFGRCQRCERPFRMRQQGSRFCSLLCAKDRHGQIGDMVTIPCERCGEGIEWVVAWAGRPHYCGTCGEGLRREYRRKHKRRHRSRRKHRQRAWHYGVSYEPIDRQYVFERDRWRCQLCAKPVARTKQVPHPKAPTVDCIVPLSVQGSPGYVLSNVHLACFLCNSRKHNRGGGEQLRLMG